MLETIIKAAQLADYDFRHTANAHDPLTHLFEDWIDYYKLKWAIAHALQPSSILEIGVRFGYSAAAFLHGNPTAHYVGIDLDTDSYGGVKGAINWAREITRDFSAKFIVADTQAMSAFPGDVYDLIHVDGQQDGDGSFHDLELAIQQGRYILVDGYLWTKLNFMAVSDFLFRHAAYFDWYAVIPGYAGELLIKVADQYLEQVREHRGGARDSSLSIRTAYTRDYYTQDCGGFDAYKKTGGKRLEDPRLQAVATIASLKQSGKLLDLGCGRGELTYYFARQGFQVTAIDYSENAIQAAQKCFEGDEELQNNVQFYCDDVCTVQLPDTPKTYDLAIASDIIEHLSYDEVDKLYERVAEYLKLDGLFVVHTAPNLWYYQYGYSRKRRIAASIGAYLPAQPRTRYEMLMHINEQSPRVLKQQLSKHFENVVVWFGNPEDFGGSLLKQFSKQEVRDSPDIFAIASHQPVDQNELKSAFQMYPLPAFEKHEVRLEVLSCPTHIPAGNEFNVVLAISNNSQFTLKSFTPNPVHISYHWHSVDPSTTTPPHSIRTKIFPPLASGRKETYYAVVKAPEQKGQFILKMTLVQEFIRWLDDEPAKLFQSVSITVR